MALQLTIHTIDVAQQEGALVVAADVAAGQHRGILIDGGLLGYAETVRNFIDPILRGYGYPLDHIPVSHYDKDLRGSHRTPAYGQHANRKRCGNSHFGRHFPSHRSFTAANAF